MSSGAWSTPSQVPEVTFTGSPLNGKERDDPLELKLRILREPLPRKVTPVAVDPLRYTDPVVVMLHDAVVTSSTSGVLNDLTEDGPPSSHETVK